MKTIKTLVLLLCGLCLSALWGCEDSRGEYLDDYQTLFYFRNGGEQTITLYTVGENTVYEIPICKSGRNRHGKGTALISVMEQTQLDIYNMANETAYTQLPSDKYKFLSDKEFAFGADDDFKVARVEIKTDEISALQQANLDKTYVLALQVYADGTVSADINLLVLRPVIGIPQLGLTVTGLQSYSYNSASPDVNTYKNKVVLDMDNRWDFTTTLEVLDAAWVADYNRENGTDFALLPAAAYDVPTTVSFETGVSSEEFEVTIDRTKGLDLLQEYILPVRLKESSKEQFDIDAESNLVCYNVRIDPDKVALTADMASSPYTHTGDGGGLPHLFDGAANADSYWHSWYGGGPVGDEIYGYYIDLHLNSPLSAVVFKYATRSNPNGVPSVIKVGVSNDGQTWTLLGTVSSGLPVSGLEWATLPVMKSATAFTYIRFGVAESTGGAGGDLTDQNGTSASTALSELELYGANLVN